MKIPHAIEIIISLSDSFLTGLLPAFLGLRLISIFSSWRLRKNQDGIYQYTAINPSIDEIQRIKLSVSNNKMLYKAAIIPVPTIADWRRTFLSLLRNLFINITYFLYFIHRLMISQKSLQVSLFFAIILSFTNPSEVLADADCIATITRYEKLYKIPTGLLKAVSKVESEHNSLALNDGLKSHNFKDKQEAIGRMNYLVDIGRTNFDVGCMQVNYHWHGKNFSSVEQMLDVNENVRYAAALIYGLYKKHGTWLLAVRHYHSYEPNAHRKYSKKIALAWLKEK